MTTHRNFPLLGYAPGEYWCKCASCGGRFDGAKHASQCLDCAVGETKAQIADLRARLQASQPDVKAGQLWRHVKTGELYKVADICIIEKTLENGVLYHAHSNNRVQMLSYMRPKNEFLDGRFVRVGEVKS